MRYLSDISKGQSANMNEKLRLGLEWRIFQNSQYLARPRAPTRCLCSINLALRLLSTYTVLVSLIIKYTKRSGQASENFEFDK